MQYRISFMPKYEVPRSHTMGLRSAAEAALALAARSRTGPDAPWSGPSWRKSRTSSPTSATHTAGPKKAALQPKWRSSHAAMAVAASGPTWKQVDQKPITAPRSVGPYQAAIAFTLPGQPVAWTKPLSPKKSAKRKAVLEPPKAQMSSAEAIMP